MGVKNDPQRSDITYVCSLIRIWFLNELQRLIIIRIHDFDKMHQHGLISLQMIKPVNFKIRLGAY